MKEQLISFETAKLAKEKEFNIPTFNVYNLNGRLFEFEISDSQTFKECPFDETEILFANWNGMNKNANSAPTQSLLQKWLREIHDITIWFSDWEVKEYSVHICQKEETKYMPNKSLGTYEQALEVGLQEALKLI